MAEVDNIMPSSVLLTVAFLFWITSKIIFIFFENVVIDNVINKEHIFRGSIFRKLKLSFQRDGSEIMATIFHVALNAFVFITLLSGCAHYCDPEACNYICDHLLFFSFFDLTLTLTILITQNFLKENPIKIPFRVEPIMKDDDIDPEVLDFIIRNTKRQQEEN